MAKEAVRSRGSGAGIDAAVAGVVLLALTVRLLALLDLSRSIYFRFLLWDERVYHDWALKLLAGTYQGTAVYEFAPLPAYLTAAVYGLFQPDPLYMRLTNTVLGTLTCYLVLRMGRELFGRAAGLLSGLTAALYGPFIFYSIVPLKAALTVFLFSACLCLFVECFRRPTVARAVLMGCFAGLALNVRPNVLFVLPVLPAAFLVLDTGASGGKRPWPRAALFCGFYLAGLAVALAPFVLRNWVVAGVPAVTTTQAGQNLYYGNNPASPVPYYRPLPFASSSPHEEGIHFTIEASRRGGRPLTHREASNYWVREVARLNLEDPVEALRKTGLKILALLNRFEAGNHYHIGFTSRFVPIFRLPFPGFGLVLPLGLAGLLVCAPRSTRVRWLALVGLLYAVTLVIFFPSTRMRLPLVPILIPAAAAGTLAVLGDLKAGRMRLPAAFFAGALFLAIISRLSLPGTGDLTAYYNTHAIALDRQGRKAEAVRYWQRSSDLRQGYSAFADLSLAAHYLAEKRFGRAAALLERIAPDSFAAAHKHHLAGDLHLTLGRVDDAVRSYRRALAINAGLREPRRKLVKIFERFSPERVEREKRGLAAIEAFYDVF